MTQERFVKTTLLAALVTMSLGGWLLHLRIHPVDKALINWLPCISGIAALIVVPLLFLKKQTAGYGYVLNGMQVIIGAILMTRYSFLNPPDHLTFTTLFLKTTLPDILVLGGKFAVGKALFDLEMFGFTADLPRGGKSYRYPNMGWWWIHVAAISCIYCIGLLLGR